jgi:hypothetical protein
VLAGSVEETSAAGFVVGFTAAAVAGLVCLRGFVAFAPDRKVSEIFDCDEERASAGAMVFVLVRHGAKEMLPERCVR